MAKYPPCPPLFSYYGSKHRIANKYPKPKYNKIIEPFAGSAAYARHYWWKDIQLYDKYEVVARLWDWLISATREDIERLPLLGEGESTDDLEVCQEAKWLIGYWCHIGDCGPPSKKLGKWAIDNGDCSKFWSNLCRSRIANHINQVNHWQSALLSYEDIPNEEATWFIDPPYQDKGKGYKESSKNIDFGHLAAWCKSRKGQVIVCENVGADWLPFEPFCEVVGQQKDGDSRKMSYEAIWTNDGSHEDKQGRLF